MKLSIIIVNYNTAEITLQCIKSIDKYPLSKNKFEVIVVDNASTDDSVKLLEKYKSKSFLYKFIKSNKNLGFSKGNNIGLRKSKGEFKLLLNSDTKVTKGSLDQLLKSAENYKQENIGLIGAKLLNENGSIQPSVFREPNIFNTIKQYLLGQNILDKYYPKSRQEVDIVVFAAVLITPLAFKKVGLLNEDYFMYFEDLDYCRKVRKNGLKIIYEPKSEIYHLHGASGNGDWKRLIPSSKIYHGKLRHYLIFLITWTSQKLKN